MARIQCGHIDPQQIELESERSIFTLPDMFFEFLAQHWYLFAMLAIILLLLAFGPNTAAAGAKKISALQLPQLQSRQGAAIVDVSTQEEFAAGHIEQSKNIPLKTLEENLDQLKKFKEKPVILVCAAGTRAPKAAGVLRKGGFSDLYLLDGGLAAWRKENLPLAKN
ncbi:MAG: rhodanese-like domain-containing protein [Pseudomonadota bacterium]